MLARACDPDCRLCELEEYAFDGVEYATPLLAPPLDSPDKLPLSESAAWPVKLAAAANLE